MQAELFDLEEVLSASPDSVEAIAERWTLFHPADTSPGFASRVARLMHQLTERREKIEAALSYSPGTHTFDQVSAMCLSGQLTLWPLPNSFLITEVHQFPSAQHYHIFLAGGDLEEIVAMHDDVITVARHLQCDKLTLTGRTGWTRALKDHGWKQHLVTVAKEI